MDEECDDFEYGYVHLGCLECGTVFPSNELFGGCCPICDSPDVTTFEDVLSYVIEHKQFMQEMGLAEEN